MSGLTIGSLFPSRTLTVAAAGRRAADYFALMKLRLVMLVLVTTAVGFCLGYGGAMGWDFFWQLAHAVFGTALVAAGAMALNQYVERETDGLMRRTMGRPLPGRRLAPGDALLLGIGIAAAGGIYLTLLVNALAAGLAVLTLLSYLFLYTPLKTRTPLCTLVGGIPGAIPPMIGYAAATGRMSGAGWALFAILFVWQMPHFYAIAWLYRQDYARAGQMMLPVIDPSGVSTARQVMGFSLLLLPITLAPGAIGAAGWVYVAGAVVLGCVFVAFAGRLAKLRTDASARQLFLWSVLYLPVLLALLVWDRRVG